MLLLLVNLRMFSHSCKFSQVCSGSVSRASHDGGSQDGFESNRSRSFHDVNSFRSGPRGQRIRPAKRVKAELKKPLANIQSSPGSRSGLKVRSLMTFAIGTFCQSDSSTGGEAEKKMEIKGPCQLDCSARPSPFEISMNGTPQKDVSRIWFPPFFAPSFVRPLPRSSVRPSLSVSSACFDIGHTVSSMTHHWTLS